MQSLTSIPIAVGAFIVTNLDDLMVLALFFGQSRLRRRDIVAGQYLGFLALLVVCLAGLVVGAVLPRNWVGWLGVVPLTMGLFIAIRQLNARAKGFTAREIDHGVPQKDCGTGALGVAWVTIANGGDNLAVYMPLFANSSTAETCVIVASFLVMVACWCLLAGLFVRHPAVAGVFNRWGDWLFSTGLIALGFHILVKSDVWNHFAT
ncbi:transporter [bacterium]|nr:transporter [bacterium]